MKPALPKAVKAAKRRNRQRIVMLCLCAMSVIIAPIAATQLMGSWLHGVAPAGEQARNNTQEIRAGTIARQIGDQQCAVAEFHNDTGRITDATGCKSATVLDARGVPVPLGTIHRLDSISKSFGGTH